MKTALMIAAGKFPALAAAVSGAVERQKRLKNFELKKDVLVRRRRRPNKKK